MGTIEETFAYDLTMPISRCEETTNKTIKSPWHALGKCIHKSKDGTYNGYFSADKIRSALSDIREHIIKTPICKGIKMTLEYSYKSHITTLHYKAEFNQIMDSIQSRGVIYTLLQLSDEQKRKGVIAISTGHFVHTLCYFGKEFGIPVTVVMPRSTAREIVVICRDLLATVIVQGDNMLDVHRIALVNARTKGLFYLDRNDHPNMIIGQATLGIEILEQMEIDVIILPTTMDGCGITAGIAVAIRESNPNIQIIEVQTDLQKSLIDVRKVMKESDELDISITRSLDWNLISIQKNLFDLRIFVSQTDVYKEIDTLIEENIEDYHAAIAIAGIRSGRLHNLINGKRVVIPFFGKMDSIISFSSYRSNLEHRAGPSTSSS